MFRLPTYDFKYSSVLIFVSLYHLNMKFINRKTHAVLDYLSVLILGAAPFLFNFANITPALYTALSMAILILLMSLFTDYEGGVLKFLHISFHLTVDVILGLVLAVSPWLFNFNEVVYLPHLIMGILIAGAGLFTVKRSPRQPYMPL